MERRFAIKTELLKQCQVIQIVAGQPGPHTEIMLCLQFTRADFSRSEIQRALVAHAACQPSRVHKLSQSANRTEAAAIDVRGPLESVHRREIVQGAVDLPQQHRGARRRAAEAGPLPVNDANLMALGGEMFGRQRTCDARTDDQNLAAEILIDRRPSRLHEPLAPRRRASAQVVLPDSLRIEHHWLQSWLETGPVPQP